MLGVGLAAALLGPAEMYCFYLLAEGGCYQYQGFGFGSFMFANLATQISGHYLIAALLIPAAYHFGVIFSTPLLLTIHDMRHYVMRAVHRSWRAELL